MQEQLAWADGLFAVGGRVTATSFLVCSKTVAIGAASVKSYVLQVNSVREESCAGVSFKESSAVSHNGPGALSHVCYNKDKASRPLCMWVRCHMWVI